MRENGDGEVGLSQLFSDLEQLIQLSEGANPQPPGTRPSIVTVVCDYQRI